MYDGFDGYDAQAEGLYNREALTIVPRLTLITSV